MPSSANSEVLPPQGTLSLYPEHAVETGFAHGMLTDAKAFYDHAAKPMTMNEKESGRVTRGVYHCPIMKISFGTAIDQCEGSEIDVLNLPHNPCIITEVCIGVSVEILVRRGRQRAYGNVHIPEANPALDKDEPNGPATDQARSMKESAVRDRQIARQYFSRPADYLSAGRGEESAMPFEWYATPLCGPDCSLEGVTLQNVVDKLNEWAYGARVKPELWDVVKVNTVSSDAVRAFLSRRVNMVSFPKFCPSPAQHIMFKIDCSTAEVPPFCLTRRESEICHSCLFHHGEKANQVQKGHASAVYTCS